MPLLFIVIPQPGDRTSGLRVPGLTFALVLLCTVSFIVVGTLQRQAGPAADDALDAALDYALRSPDLDRADLQHLCDDLGRPRCLEERAADPAAGDTFVAERGAGTGAGGGHLLDPEQTPAPDPIPRAQRTHLAHLVEQARDAHLAQPAVVLGLTRARLRAHAALTHVLVHADVVSLVVDVLLLWLALGALESAQRRGALAALVVGGGAAVGMARVLLPGVPPLVPVLGAQGVVAVVIGAYLARFGRRRLVLRALAWFGRSRSGQVSHPAWVLLPVYLAWVLVASLALHDRTWGLLAPLLGLPVGAAANLLLARAGLAALPEDASHATPEDSPLFRQARSAVERQEWETAVRIYQRLEKEFPEDVDLRISRAEALAAAGRRDEADVLYREEIGRLLRSGRVSAAARRYEQMGRTTGAVDLPPDQLLAIADHHARERRDHHAIRAYERHLDAYPEHAGRTRALLGAIGLLIHQPEGRDRARDLLREARRLIGLGAGSDHARRRLEELEAALHQLPAPHESRHREVEGQPPAEPVDHDALSRNIEDWVATPVQPPPRQRDPLDVAMADWATPPSAGAAGSGDTPAGSGADPAHPGDARVTSGGGPERLASADDATGPRDGATGSTPPPAGVDLEVPRALRSRVLHPRVSALTAIEPRRLRFETADGAPFQVPIDSIQFVSVARIWYREETVDGLESLLCDLVHGVHHTGAKVVVESVRLLSDRLPYGRLLPRAGPDDGDNFRRVLDLLRPLLVRSRFVPARAADVDGEIPTFSDLDQYERALLQRIARDD